MKKTTLISLGLLVTLLASACQSQPAQDATEANSSEQENSTQQQEQDAKKVETWTVGKENSQAPQATSKKLGIVQADKVITVKAESGGKVTGFDFEEGETVFASKTLASLGASLNTDIQEITYQNALITLKNAQEQLEEKHKANLLSLENTALTIDQAAIQLDSAYTNKENINRTGNLTINQLMEQNHSSYSDMVSHLRDLVKTGYEAVQKNPNSNSYYQNNHLSGRLLNLENNVNTLDYYRGNVPALNNTLINGGELLGDIKESMYQYSYDPYYDNYSSRRDYYYRNSSTGLYPDYGTHNSADSTSTDSITTDYSMSADSTTSAGSTGSATSSGSASSSGSTNASNAATLAALNTKIAQLQGQIQGDKSALLQIQQSIVKTADGQITLNSTADSQIALAQTQLENAKQLYTLKEAQIALEEQATIDQIEQLIGQVELAKRNRDAKNITAPITGTLTKKLVQEGDMISPGQSIAEIARLDILKVSATVTQKEIDPLSLNQPVTIITDAGDPVPGKITKIPTTFNSQSKTAELEITIERTPATYKLLPGMVVSIDFATIAAPGDANALFIPLKSVYFDNTENYVYIIKDGHATRKTVKTGRIDDTSIEVKSGLATGDQIITSRYGIQEGDQVEG